MTATTGLNEPADGTETPSASAAERRFLRSRTNRVLAGVCGGIAEYYGSDVTAVRILAVVIAVFTGILPLLFLYLVAAVLIPERLDGAVPTAGSTNAVAAPTRGAGLVIGVVLVAIGVLALANEVMLVDWDVLWPFALVALGGGLIVVAYRK